MIRVSFRETWSYSSGGSFLGDAPTAHYPPLLAVYFAVKVYLPMITYGRPPQRLNTSWIISQAHHHWFPLIPRQVSTSHFAGALLRLKSCCFVVKIMCQLPRPFLIHSSTPKTLASSDQITYPQNFTSRLPFDLNVICKHPSANA